MKIITLGELLLRLSAPGYTRMLQTNSFEATFCGSEANVAVSLSNFGLESVFVTKLPDNSIGKAAANSLRYFGVDISHIKYGDGRIGLYYLEKGASQRPSRVIYDRKESLISQAEFSEFDWNLIFKGADWFHWSGINPALSERMQHLCLEACKKAKELGLTVSCDLNYRKTLWSEDQAQSVMPELMQYTDVCIGNEEDAEKMLGIKMENSNIESAYLCKEDYRNLAQTICERYNCKYVAFTLRESYSASENNWSGMLYSHSLKQAFFSSNYKINIIDRVGSGDSFSAGLIFGLLTMKDLKEALEFAVASSCLKHSIEGDFNRSSVTEVMELVSGYKNGRVQR